MDEHSGSARKRSADAFKRADYNNDYLAERCGWAPSPCRIIDRPRYLDDRPDHQSNDTCHASRPVDGGVDSQA
jgi:hypothetical protein